MLAMIMGFVLHLFQVITVSALSTILLAVIFLPFDKLFFGVHHD